MDKACSWVQQMRKKLDLQYAIRAAERSCHLAWHLAAQPVYTVGSNWQWANFTNFSMKLLGDISEICIFQSI